MKAETTKSGLKIYDEKGKHVRTVPNKYDNVWNIIVFSDSKFKRPSDEERFKLELAYFEHSLKRDEKYIYELIQDSAAKVAQPVRNHIGEERFEMIYENGTRVKINRELFDLFPEKMETRYSNY